MDPDPSPRSTLPLHHEPYGPIRPECLRGANTGKVAVVTGAARGIGRAIAIALAVSGAKLALLDLSVEAQEATKAAVRGVSDVQVETIQCDITDTVAVKDTFKAIKTTLGPVDILVNNAGIARGNYTVNESFEDFWGVIEVNLKGTMLCTYEVLPGMSERKSGCIINIASRAAGVDMPKSISYGASKAAVAHATASLQEEFEMLGLGEHLHTYCLHPGGVWGDMITTFTTPDEREKLRPLFNEVPELAAYTVAYLAAGRAKELRGMYFDCRHDIKRVCDFGRDNLKASGLHNLRMRFVPGYDNAE